jgi:uncharacterized protein (TIGR00251 family)
MGEELELTAQQDGVILTVWVQPRSRRDEVVGVRGGMLRVRLMAPPVGGAANEALARFLARRLGVPPSSLEIVHGHRSRRKRIKVYGLSLEEVRALLH